MKYSLKLYILNGIFLLMLVMYVKFMGYCDVNKCGELFLKYMEE